MARNYVAELRALIDAETNHGAYVPRQVAEKLVAYLRETDPELLSGWLDDQAEHFIWQMINDRDRSRRAQGKERANRVAFAVAAGQYAEGDAAALGAFLDMPFPSRPESANDSATSTPTISVTWQPNTRREPVRTL
jgi:hypothetical protein